MRAPLDSESYCLPIQGPYSTGSILTRAEPAATKSSSCAAWWVSRIAVRLERNRSLIRTVTDLPLAMFVSLHSAAEGKPGMGGSKSVAVERLSGRGSTSVFLSAAE